VKIHAIVPAYRVSRQICGVIESALGQALVSRVIVVDDACPESSGKLVSERFAGNPRVEVLFNAGNQGVGGAVLRGYSQAFAAGADIAVKLDGDGQMPVAMLGRLVAPLLRGDADYAKGNRFFHPRELAKMPRMRLLGNAALSLINKFSSGYWSVMDPTNGFTALHRVAYRHLETARIARDYFFESDMLHQLGIIRAVVVDVPAPVIYGEESSSLRISRTLMQFPGRYLRRFLRRLVYQYLIRDFNIASLESLAGLPLFIAGLVFGGYNWAENSMSGRITPPGTVMITGLLILIGFQLLLSAANYDITHEPSTALLRLEAELPGSELPASPEA
jgi:dolichol-phosphate mannosyltransferase